MVEAADFWTNLVGSIPEIGFVLQLFILCFKLFFFTEGYIDQLILVNYFLDNWLNKIKTLSRQATATLPRGVPAKRVPRQAEQEFAGSTFIPNLNTQ